MYVGCMAIWPDAQNDLSPAGEDGKKSSVWRESINQGSGKLGTTGTTGKGADLTPKKSEINH